MMADGNNQGMQVSGGSVTAGAIAVGTGAWAHNVANQLRERGQDDVAQRLEELVRQLEAHADQVSDIEDLRGATRTVADELAKEQPNKTTVTAVLSTIAESVQSVTGLATAADALLRAVQAVF
jgi:translation initiation factor 2B subunit (eIF-2B alpha/beta/delta family)